MTPRYMDKRTAATYTAVSSRTLDYARARHELPSYPIGQKVVFRIDDLNDWMESHRRDPRPNGGNQAEGGAE